MELVGPTFCGHVVGLLIGYYGEIIVGTMAKLGAYVR